MLLKTDARGSRRKHLGQSVVPAIECSSEMNVMPTTANQIERAIPCVKNSTNVKNAAKLCRAKKGNQKITCVE